MGPASVREQNAMSDQGGAGSERCGARRVGQSSHRVVELLQTGDSQEAVHADAILHQQLHKLHAVHGQGVQQGLLQGAHLQPRTSVTFCLPPMLWEQPCLTIWLYHSSLNTDPSSATKLYLESH